MELAIIGRRLCEPLTGVGRYLQYLLYHWSREETQFDRIIVYTPAEPNLPPLATMPPVEVRVEPSRGLSPLLWENLLLPAKLRGADLLFAPYTLPWMLAGRGVVSNLGIYESRSGDFPWKDRLRTTPFFRHSVRKARCTIANSHSTRADLVRYYAADPSKIKVVYLGVDEYLSPDISREPGALPAEIRSAFSVPLGPFFLFVGKLSKRRNVPLLIEAFAELRRAGKLPHSLVIIGPDYAGVGVPRVAAGHGVADAVCYVPYAPTEVLAEFYRAATAFVLPTLHEGFSMTILEAMACGAPVIVFAHEALEAGVREAALVIQDPSRDALAEALLRLAGDAALRGRLRQTSLECAANFGWRKTARETMRILERAAASPPST